MSDNRNMTDAELDALFKNADNATPIPAFDDVFWGEMEAMLPAKKRVGAFFWWISGAALVVGIVVLTTIYGFNDKTKTNRSFAGKNEPNKEETITNSAITENENNIESSNKNSIQTPEVAVNKRTINTGFVPSDNTPANNGGTPNDGSLNKTNDENPLIVEVSNQEEQLQLIKRNALFTTPVVLNDISVDRKLSSGLPLYTEFSVGFGQSYKRIEFSNNWSTQFRLGVGLTKEVPGMQLSCGLAFRAEMPNNLSSFRSENSSSGVQSTVNNYRGLYSLEFPLEAAGKFGRNALGLFMVPGIQLGYTGNSSHYQNEMLQSRERTSGSLSDAKTMTMECGLKYSFDISEHMQFTSSCTFDMVRPFQSTYYQGENQDYPVTFFVGLRRKF